MRPGPQAPTANRPPRSWSGAAAAHRLVSAAAAVSVCVTIGTGTAYGYFTAAGTGQGTPAAATSLSALTTTATTPSGALLYPGSAKVPLTLTITNPGPRPVQVTAVVVDSSRSTVMTGNAGACTTGITVTLPGSVAINVAAGATVAQTIASVVQFASTTVGNGCQGATFTIPVVLTGKTT